MMAVERLDGMPMLGDLLVGIAATGVYQALPVSGLTLDSRAVQPGDVFIACAGARQHGLAFAHEARQRGAVAMVWEPVAGHPALPADLPAIRVPDLAGKAGIIADRFYAHPSRDLFVIGITGTDGKTSCAHFIAQALHRDDAPCGLLGTLGYGLYGEMRPASHTTPDPVTLHRELARLRDHHARVAVMEVSSHALDQQRVAGVAFDVAAFTNISRDHLDYHGDMSAYRNAKRRLFQIEGLRHAVINADDPFGLELLRALPDPVAAIACGTQGEPPRQGLGRAMRYLWGTELHLDDRGLSFSVDSSWGDGRVQTNLLGRFNVSNLLTALGVLLAHGMDLDTACARLSQTRAVPGRMQRFGGDDKPLVVVDYAHTPAALEQVLQALRAHCRGELWCVFGAGGDRDRGKRPDMGAAAERCADYVVITNDNPRHEDPAQIIEDIRAGMQKPAAAMIEPERADAIRRALHAARPGDVVLIAGKGHEIWQQVGDARIPFSDTIQVAAALGEGTA